ncbi:MAG: hypothetical protein LBO70_01100 [Clostridiales Family XIII bacterium]|jgi:tRNA (guanine-N7-)-methyltransferase|nr:hypothetical protein [Clostridiales Family XIII bacterium]
MRQKKIKNIEGKIARFSGPLVDEPCSFRTRWREVFRADGPLYLEIGCGKGRFIKASALKDPGSLYLGFEGQRSVMYRALQRAYVGPDVAPRDLNTVAMASVGHGDGPGDRPGDLMDNCGDSVSRDAGLPGNLLFCAAYILDMRDYFEEGELDGIFLNFSDPWPKLRQSKRRLTSPDYLRGYLHTLADGGFIRFKTDNADFFVYSRECISSEPGLEITAMTDDLRASEYAEGSEMTEYEMKFVKLGKKIHYLEARKSP